MPHLAELGAIEVIGTAGNDALSGRDQAVIFGRQGQDALTSNGDLSSDQWFFGGSGSDRYVVRPGTSVFVGDGFRSAGDVVRAGGIGFDQPYTVFAEIEGRHLLILDFESYTNVMILDWLHPERAIERLELADGSRTLSAAAIRSLDNYAGNFTLEEIFAGAPPGVADLFRAFVREGFERAAEIESTPQPALVQIIGTAADDELVGDARPEVISGAAGRDEIFGNGGDDQLIGGVGVDFIEGGGGADLLDGGADGDVLRGGAGADELRGGSGGDTMFGDAGDDILIGGREDDDLSGGGRADVLSGGRGNDQLNGGLGSDVLDGGLGDDQLAGNEGDDVLSGGPGRDWLFGHEGADTLNGNADSDQLDGGPGADILRGGLSGDTLLGDLDDDVLLGGPGADGLEGGSGSDRLQGGRGADTLLGDIGGDILDGQDGDDFLEGGRGADLLTGGPGSDRFSIRSETTVDQITDFSEADVLRLGLVVSGVSGTPTGEELDDFLQFVFDGTNTTLEIDEDGAGDFTSPETSVELLGVDLVGGASSQAEVIDGLLAGGQIDLA